MDPTLALSSFALIFAAEMGDKTQLMAMALAHRYPVRPVLAGVFAAFAVLNALAVLAGAALDRLLPERAVLTAAGLLFLVFAWRTWREAGGDGAERPAGTAARSAFLASFGLILLAELGDKTQLAMVALAAGGGDPAAVFTGGTLALWAVSGLGIAVGGTLLRRLPPGWMHRGAAALFAVFGLAALARAWLLPA
ncbi:TMEM165/GDT1 family protein [Inmirania thermothiophila]|uniref:GDT1 family protein n=1 Tax=Inmirania thermothiophila TaxID=1750597 RepID=A0A3N1Y035_9GAMM|nr:TMEM165/GDT1 family protein [Inmirania thermothiophila]ROR32205.1 putative Ca2+/H+ antiporter (TMEM165/GDT1 family) [Inmirania thermothiophila]